MSNNELHKRKMNNQKYQYNENGRVIIPDDKEIRKKLEVTIK